MIAESGAAVSKTGWDSDIIQSLLIGQDSSMVHTREMIARVAPTDATVLFRGETGTGKEVAARALWMASNRRQGPFVALNCGAVPAELLESELFGHEKGAFTGAVAARQGRFELAKGGILFLDEIGDMPLPMQVKLLRVLQERRFERVGSNRSIEANVRIIAATHRDLEAAIEAGEFREDLYYRLNVVPIDLPPLRERARDLVPLMQHLSRRLMGEGGAGVRFSSAAIEVLKNYRWPGNVRELANVVERFSVLFPGEVVDVGALPAKILQTVEVSLPPELSRDTIAEVGAEPAGLPENALVRLPEQGLDLRDHLRQLEASLIQQALNKSNGVVAHAAELLHVQRTTLVEKIRKYAIERPREVSEC